MLKFNYYLPLLILIMIGIPSMGWAHRVVVFAWVEGDHIRVDAGFNAKRPCKNAPTMVLSTQGDVILEGKTNDQGQAAFFLGNIPKEDVIIRVESGPGHAGQWQLSQWELEPSTNSARTSERPDKEPSMAKILLGIAGIFTLFMGAQKLIIPHKRKVSHERG